MSSASYEEPWTINAEVKRKTRRQSKRREEKRREGKRAIRESILCFSQVLPQSFFSSRSPLSYPSLPGFFLLLSSSPRHEKKDCFFEKGKTLAEKAQGRKGESQSRSGTHTQGVLFLVFGLVFPLGLRDPNKKKRILLQKRSADPLPCFVLGCLSFDLKGRQERKRDWLRSFSFPLFGGLFF